MLSLYCSLTIQTKINKKSINQQPSVFSPKPSVKGDISNRLITLDDVKGTLNLDIRNMQVSVELASLFEISLVVLLLSEQILS